MTEPILSPEAAKALAGQLFNRTWELIDLADRTPEQELEMIHSAHASRAPEFTARSGFPSKAYFTPKPASSWSRTTPCRLG